MSLSQTDLEVVYPRCRTLLGDDVWRRLVAGRGPDRRPEHFPESIGPDEHPELPGFLSDLARLERCIWQTKTKNLSPPLGRDATVINPTLSLLELHWKHLAHPTSCPETSAPEPGSEAVLVWKHPESGDVRMKAASPEDLLVLKMISEGIDRKDVAKAGGLPVGAVDTALDRAAGRALILAPPSQIRRDFVPLDGSPGAGKQFLQSPSFTLQWHITQACDLDCRHCYDRSDRSPLTREQALKIIADLELFCRERHVKGQISFTGGNPLLHPDFFRIYEAAFDRGFTLCVLGNPAPREQVERLIAIGQPEFFQVSLEGLPPYNDYIRGDGHFERTLRFLDMLRELGVYSLVMLTLTQGNLHDVIPLGELLRGKADVFYFNRLSKLGQGADLDLPSRRDYVSFLEQYIQACAGNPVLGLKDNLFNVLLDREGADPFGGCTGFGCGAAFNFVALLADGEVHACRKFPSPIGNIFQQGLAGVYDSEMAQRYRAGSAECRSCRLRPVCGGCLASAYSGGLDLFEKKDPFCFL